MSRDIDYTRLINTARWRKLRFAKLKEKPMCEECYRQGKFTPASQVHHISPVERADTFTEMKVKMYDYNNLMSVCPACHKDIHTRLKSNSRTNIRKNNDRRTRTFIDRFL